MKKTFIFLLALIMLGTCTACGHTHEFTDKEIAQKPTCTSEGKIVYTCSCGETTEEPIEKIPHDYVTSKTTTPATVKEEGVLTHFCKCGDTITESIPALTPYEGFVDYIITKGKKSSNSYKLEFGMPVSSSSLDYELSCEYNSSKNTINIYSSMDYGNGMSADFTLYLVDDANRYEWEAEAFFYGSVIFVAGGDVNPNSFTANSALSYSWSRNGILGTPPSNMIETFMGFFSQSLRLACAQLDLELSPSGISISDFGFTNY